MSTLRVSSWNVNGLRSIMRKGLAEWLARTRPDVAGLQEVRAHPHQVEDELRALEPWAPRLHPAQRPGYSGVGLLGTRPPDEVHTTLGPRARRFDVEGRVQLARYGRLWVVNVYMPNGSGKDRDNSRIPYKLAFYRSLFRRLEPLKRSGERVLVLGDFNTAHRDIDLARPRENEKTSGFTPVERRALDAWLRAGWVDTFRAFEEGPGHYTWWSQRQGVREKNIGWRLDLVLASPAAMRFVEGAFIEKDVRGSDHCPVGVTLRRRVTGRG